MSVELIGYAAFFLTMALTYAIICLGLNVQWGQTGLFNVGVAGFVAIGAYVSALLTTPDDAEPPRRLRPADRARLAGRRARRRPRLVPDRRADDQAARRLSRHRHLRRRRDGAARRAQPRTGHRRTVRHRLHSAALRGLCRRSARCSACSISACSPLRVVVLYLALERLVRSPWGRVLRAIREDEAAALALGKNAVEIPAAGLRHRRRHHGAGRRRAGAFHRLHRAGQLHADADLPGLGDADRRRLRQQSRRDPRRGAGLGHLGGIGRRRRRICFRPASRRAPRRCRSS